MKIIFVFLSFFFVACSGVVSDLKESFGFGEDVDYSQCKKYEEKAKDNNLPMVTREQAFKDLSNCRETAKSLHKSK